MPEDSATTPASVMRLVRVCNMTYAVALPCSFLVATLYWGLVYEGGHVRPTSWLTHGVNFGVMAVDASVNSQPYPLLHGLWFFAYCLMYLFATLVFYWTDFTIPCNCNDDEPQAGCDERGDGDYADRCEYIYSSLNWNEPKSTASLGGLILMVVAPVTVLLAWVLVLYRRVLHSKNIPANPASTSQVTRFDKFSIQHQGSEQLLASEGVGAAFLHELRLERTSPVDKYWIEHFGGSKQQCLRTQPRLFLATRVVNLSTVAMSWCWALTRNIIIGHGKYWFVYLTNLTLTVELVYLTSALVLTILAQPRLQALTAQLARGSVQIPERTSHPLPGRSSSEVSGSFSSMTSDVL